MLTIQFTSMKEFAVVNTKIPKELQTQLKFYCDKEGITPSAFIRDLIRKNISNVVPINKAGINKFVYDKKYDLFKWVIENDDNTSEIMAEAASSGFLENLRDEIEIILSERNEYIQKYRKNSVLVPSQLKHLKVIKYARH